MKETLRWVFIIIGFLGACLTILISVVNLHNTRKRNVSSTLIIQYIIVISNVAMFSYGFGLSMINLHESIFYNSMPTWIGNGISFIVNLTITIIIHVRLFKNKIKVRNAGIV